MLIPVVTWSYSAKQVMKVVILFVFAMCMCAVAALTDSQIDREWEKFKVNFGKKYKSKNEEQFRKGIFLETLEEIVSHNRRYKEGLEPYPLRIYEFADQIPEEWNGTDKDITDVNEVDELKSGKA